MKRRPVVVSLIIVLAVVWTVVDLGTKHWAKHHLATAVHLLSVDYRDGETVAQAFANHFGIRRQELKGRVYVVEGPIRVKPQTTLREILVDYPILFVFKGSLDYAARVRLHGEDDKKILASIEDAIHRTIKIDKAGLNRILREGLYGLPRGKATVTPDEKTEKGKRYLLSYRVITVIPGLLAPPQRAKSARGWGGLGES